MNFLIDLASHPHFRAADVHTGFIHEHFNTLFPAVAVSETQILQTALALLAKDQITSEMNSRLSVRPNNPFNVADNLRLNHPSEWEMKLKFQDVIHRVFVQRSIGGQLKMRVGEGGVWRLVESKIIPQPHRLTIRSTIDGDQSNFSAVISEAGQITLFDATGKTEMEVVPAKFLSAQDMTGAAAGSAVVSPMPGVLDKLFVEKGAVVKKGDPLAVIIAMKMEHVLKAPKDAVVKSVGGKPGDNMAKGSAIVTFEEDENTDSSGSSSD